MEALSSYLRHIMACALLGLPRIALSTSGGRCPSLHILPRLDPQTLWATEVPFPAPPADARRRQESPS